jgi:hypothetical protein
LARLLHRLGRCSNVSIAMGYPFGRYTSPPGPTSTQRSSEKEAVMSFNNKE